MVLVDTSTSRSLFLVFFVPVDPCAKIRHGIHIRDSRQFDARHSSFAILMYPQLILRLIQSCEAAAQAGVCREEIRNRLLPEKVQHLLKTVAPADFLEWVQLAPDYGYYFKELQQSGVGLQPREAAAMILEAIVLDAIE